MTELLYLFETIETIERIEIDRSKKSVKGSVWLEGYQTVAGFGESVYVDKKSKFLGFCYPVTSEEEAQTIIAQYEKKYHDATHVVYAYQIGAQDEKMRSTDNGEPAGTAGKPILELLRQEGFHDTLVIVVRYFGGTLLGTGGLVRAYSKCASLALEAVGKAEVVWGIEVLLSIPYECLDLVEKKIKQYDAVKINISYTEVVALHLQCPLANWASLQQALQTIGQDAIHMMILTEEVKMIKRKES